jgi:hypothetical protein
METPVDVLYKEFKAFNNFLHEKGEISFQISLETQYKKSLVMAAASYFESEILLRIEEFYIEKSNGDNTIVSFVRNKAIKRQYHSYFSWDKTNGYTQFFGLLGLDFQTFMKDEMKKNSKLTSALEAFISLGNERNLLAHLNYASYDVTKTIDEIYSLYNLASYFVNGVPNLLRKISISE